MKKRTAVVLSVLLLLLPVLFGCSKTEESTDAFQVKTGETFSVTVAMENSGAVKSMALTLYFDENAFELVDGAWLAENGIIADFNRETKDAAIAFEEETELQGEVFEFQLTAKKDLTIIDDIIVVEPILKNGRDSIVCKGLTLLYSKS